MKNKQTIDADDKYCINFMNRKIRAERKRLFSNEEVFKRYVIRRAFFVLGKRYRSFNLLNDIANKAIERLTYDLGYELPLNQNIIDRAIVEVYVNTPARYWVRATGWFGKNRIKDIYIAKFKGE